MSQAQQKLLDKLDELKIWQEQQKEKLVLKQQTQREMLDLERAKLYQILGINSSSLTKTTTEVSLVSTISNDFEENQIEEIDENSSEEEEEKKVMAPPKKSPNDPVKLISPLRNLDLNKYDPVEADLEKPVIKKPFLKRGAGLTTRFRVHPDKFKLENLPKYKFANKSKTEPKTKEKRPAVDTKKSVTSKPSTSKSQQQTVDIKPKEKVTEWFKSCEENRDAIEETPRFRKDPKPVVPKAISWANILGGNSSFDTSVNLSDLRSKIQELDAAERKEIAEINLFELLEDKLKDSSFISNNSTILKVLEALQNQPKEEVDMEDKTLVDENIAVNLRVQQMPGDAKRNVIIESDSSEEPESDEEEEEEYEEKDEHRVRFSDNVVVVNNSQVDETRDHFQEIPDDPADQTDDAATVLSTDLEAIELSKTSTPNEKQDFHEFKKKLLGKKSQKSITPVFHQQQEIKEKGDLMKIRLEELEKEIESFREQNSVLIRMKQELELEKIQFDNDREEMLEKLKDERIQMEIFLHDERLKLEEEKKRCEKMVREARNPNRKERDEVTKLKATIEEMKDEAKAKEARHGSSQARFRAQIRQLEKDNQSQKLELEVLRKEIKKLEMENIRLRRETNSKMLQEINKNIAKLAPICNEPEAKKKDAKKPMKPPAKGVPARRSEPTFKEALKKRFRSEPDLSSKSDEEDDDVELQKEVSISSFEEEFVGTRNSKNPMGSSNGSNKENQPMTSRKSSDLMDEMKREINNADGSKDIWYPNGNLKKISPDGMLIRMLYYNKDIKETNINEGTVKYYYADRNTWHTTYIDGLEILEYPDGQTEHRYKDGTVELHYPNGSIRITKPGNAENVREEWRYSDGSNIKIFTNNTKIVQFPNGQREIHTENHSRREFPDGTVKIVYKDGSQETRYSDGRIRIKDKDGQLISDTLANVK